MNGDTSPKMDRFQAEATALNAVELIYNLSEQCLMAHTIRAIETHVCREYRKPHYPIILHVDRGVQSRWGSKSWAIVTATVAHVQVEANLSRDQQRVCIAHECYHILEFFRPTKTKKADKEDFCDLFANKLCEKHNSFYNNHEKVSGCKFGHLPINSKRENC